MYVRRRAEVAPYVTRDGSTIREWAGPGYSPAAVHQLHDTGTVDLVVVCACAPVYSHEDTFLCEGGGA